MKYDPTDKDSIYEYAKNLKGKSFNDICNDYYIENTNFYENTFGDSITSYSNIKKKGSLGELVEEMYFHYKANSESLPDFPEAEVELKVTPYKVNKNKTLSAKERLIISMIDYMKIVDMEFYTSNAWKKLKNLLLILYKWDNLTVDKLDYVIDYIYMYTPFGEDLEIIKKDFYKIKQKVLEGKAHELSEGDTLYLGAATKSSDSKKRRYQPFSEIPAKPRAFSLKQSYMTYILRNYILDYHEKQDKILKDKSHTDFEVYVLNKINSEIGKSEKELIGKYFNGMEIDSKDKFSRIAFKILGVNSNNAEEFVKANIVVKAIRVKNDKIKESMSFPVFKIKELIKEDWEDSNVYEFFSTTKFLFVVYEEENGEYILKGSKFWNMPSSDIDNNLKNEWEEVRDKFISGVNFDIKDNRISNDLPKKNKTEIIHVRPHARRSVYKINGVVYGRGILGVDSDDLPNGDKMTKQCFWLNNTYILKQIKDLL